MTEPWGIDEYVQSVMPAYTQELEELIRIPSISQKPEHTADLKKVVEAASSIAQRYGFTTTIVEGDHPPGLVADIEVNPQAPWVLIYNHMDVQPADEPEWTTKPFEPVVRDGKIIGRGSTDDAGPALAALHAVHYLHSTGRLPVNVRILYETEEENGSTHFPQLLENSLRVGNMKSPDSILVSDTIFEGDNPAITYSLRGLLRAKVSLETAATHVHSGMGGGVVVNPNNVLMQALATCYTKDGKLAIPAAYEGVVEPVGEELVELRRVAEGVYDHQKLLADLGARAAYTSNPLEAVQRLWTRPTFEVHNMTGVQGTKIPKSASADVTIRLVGNQNPAHVLDALRQHLQAYDSNIEVEGRGTPAVRTPLDNAFMQRAAEACEVGFGKGPVYVGCGGTIGALPPIQKAFSHAPIILLAMSKASDGYHAPNEQFELAQAAMGMKAVAHYLSSIGDLRTR